MSAAVTTVRGHLLEMSGDRGAADPAYDLAARYATSARSSVTSTGRADGFAGAYFLQLP